MYKIIEKFLETFGPWNITIDDQDIFVGNQKTILQGDWYIKFNVEEDEKGIFLEYYGIHKRNEHLHARIYENGEEQKLDILQQYIAYSPDILGDREKRTTEFEIYNNRVLKELREKQLLK